MVLTVTLQEAAYLRKALVRLIKHKNQNIACIRRKMEADPDNAPLSSIRSSMIERCQRSIAEAESLLLQLNVVTVE